MPFPRALLARVLGRSSRTRYSTLQRNFISSATRARTMDPPAITVTPLGRKSLRWLPTGEEPAVVLAPELEERRRLFIRYIEEKLLHYGDDSPSTQLRFCVGSAIRKSELHAAHVVATDPALAAAFLGPLRDSDLHLDEQDLHVWLAETLHALQGKLIMLLRSWSDDNGRSGSRPRPANDKRAQSIVRAYYGNRCVLTGVNRTEGAHIVPVRVTTRDELQTLWIGLSSFLAVDRRADLSYRGREPNNILPLARGAHSRWDAFEFYLRPVPDPVAPADRLFLQLVWADNELAVGTPSGDAALPEVANGRCPVGDAAYAPVRTGDVFLLETADPSNCPLPSLEFLQIQAGTHRILGGLRAAATLTSLFQGPPPSDDNAVVAAAMLSLDEDGDLPHLWQVLLEAAVAKNILSLRDAGCWARGIVRHFRERERFWQRLLTKDSGSSGED